MGNVLLKAGSCVLIILTGYLLKKGGLFRKEENLTIMKLIQNVTLPAAVITGFSDYERNLSLLNLLLLGLFLNLFMIAAGLAAARNKDKAEKAFYIVNFSGYNIGTFTLPYLQSFLGNQGVVTACLFDSGNAFMCMGITYVIASTVVGGKDDRRASVLLKRLFRSIPFDAYLLMILFYLMDIRLPEPVYTVTRAFSSANAFLAMFMIGGALEFCFDKKKLSSILTVLVFRYGTAICIAILFYYCLPFSPDIKKILIILVFSPITSMGVINTQRLGGDTERAGILNSVSILISLAVMTGLMGFWKIGS